MLELCTILHTTYAFFCIFVLIIVYFSCLINVPVLFQYYLNTSLECIFILNIVFILICLIKFSNCMCFCISFFIFHI